MPERAADVRARLIVEAAHDAFVECTADGVVIDWNPAAEILFRWPRDAVAGRPLSETVFPEPAASKVQGIVDGYSESDVARTYDSFEVDAVRRDGTHIHVQLTVWPVRVGGELRVEMFAHDLTERIRFQEELRRLAVAATTDPGTGLKNRRGFFALAEHELNVAKRLGQTLTLIFFDLDRLKGINDSLGHLQGDRAIADAAEIVKSTFRESDLVARLGGDELCVLALGSERAVEETIGRLEAALARHNAEAGRPYELSLSYGVAFYRPDGPPMTLDDLISEADRSMYARKLQHGRPV